MIWATGQMDGPWMIDRLGIASTKGRDLSYPMLFVLRQRSREPVAYDELLLPQEAPGGRDRRGDLSECDKRW
jgi:hypothetical protein